MKKIFSIPVILITVALFQGCSKPSEQAGKPSNRMPLEFTGEYFTSGGKPLYLISGEFHYFRVPRSDWRSRMQLLKQAGGNCIATYIPWLIHEPTEGRFTFTGADMRDLEGFLKTAAEEGLYVIARPGPYQYSELLYDGLPQWLTEKYPQLRAKNIEGNDFRRASLSYMHPLFLEKVEKWFDAVCPIIRKYTILNGGPIAMVQLDNEVMGIHVWNGSLDYNPETMGFGKEDGRYSSFLKNKYLTIDSVNNAYETSFKNFAAVTPLPVIPYTSVSDIRRIKDYADFYFDLHAGYLAKLAFMVRRHDIRVPLSHNSANPDMNGMLKETVEKLGNKKFLLGTDNYYTLDQTWRQNNPTPQYAARTLLSLEMLRVWGYPPMVCELPAGSLSSWPPVTATDARACYWMHMAYGMKGFNLYIFTGGINPPGLGTTTDLYDYGAPVGPAGEIRPHYAVIKEIGGFIRKNPWFIQAERINDCWIGLNYDYSRAYHYMFKRGNFLFNNAEAWNMMTTGALTTALCANMSPAFLNLDSNNWTDDISRPLIVVSSDCMSKKIQQTLIAFIKKGGNLMITPVIPYLDENFNPCTDLLEYLGNPVIRHLSQVAFPRINVQQVKNIMSADAFYAVNIPPDAMILGKDDVTQNTICYKYSIKNAGTVIFLGINWLHAQQEHINMLSYLLEELGMDQRIICDNPSVWTSLRVSGDKHILFLMNLMSSPMEATVDCKIEGKLFKAGIHKLKAMEVKYVLVK